MPGNILCTDIEMSTVPSPSSVGHRRADNQAQRTGIRRCRYKFQVQGKVEAKPLKGCVRAFSLPFIFYVCLVAFLLEQIYSTFHIINKWYGHFPLEKSEKKAISLKSWNDILGFVLWFSKHTIYKKTLLTLFNGFLPTSIIYV